MTVGHDTRCERPHNSTSRAHVAAPLRAPAPVHDVLRSPGQPLEGGTRARMEPLFGHDFSRVRIHADQHARGAAAAIGARAYAAGPHIVFGAAQYQPESAGGRRLLAHELAHVIQQERAGTTTGGRTVADDPRAEAEADEAAGRMFVPGASRVVVSRAAGAGIYRQPASQPAEQPAPPQPVRQPAPPQQPQQPAEEVKPPKADAEKVPWADAVKAAEAENKRQPRGKEAERQYRDLIVRAAARVTPPAPLPALQPAPHDFAWEWSTARGFSAAADPNKVGASAKNFWNWLIFNPWTVHRDEAFTISIIAHELDHAAYLMNLRNTWIASGKKKAWADFYTKQKGKVPDAAYKPSGPLAQLAGLPSTIDPSAIEFRAYTSMLVQYFHKVTPEYQEYMARSIVLFYPLKAGKGDTARAAVQADVKRILDYYANPPVADQAQREIVQRRLAAEIQLARAYRLDALADLNAAFDAIVKNKVDADDRREDRRLYKPQP